MRLLLVVAPGAGCEPSALVPGGRLAVAQVARPGTPREAGLLGLLGQAPTGPAWSGPAAFYAAAAGVHLVREEETAYLLDFVRVDDDGVITGGVAPWSESLREEILGRLEEALAGEPVSVCAAPVPVLVLGQPCVGPPQLASAAPEVGARWRLPAGPPALLQQVVDAGRAACAAAGRPGCAVIPHTPSGPGEVTPLREAWLGLGPSRVVGSRPEALALARLLSLSHAPAGAGDELRVAHAEGVTQDLVVAVCDGAPRDLGAWGSSVVVVAGDAGVDGTCELAWRGGPEALGSGPHLLGALLLGVTDG